MSCYQIEGGHPLTGQLTVQGAKNSVLPILAATLLACGESTIHNCPTLSDVTATIEILTLLGCKVRREGSTLTVDTSALCSCEIPDSLMREMRSSVIFLGALLSRLGTAQLSYPGGCDLGSRPIDLHLAALRTLGVDVFEQQGSLYCQCGKDFLGRRICLSLPSVGATENAMLAACGCTGVTTIVGAACEPEIVDLQMFLRSMGAEVYGAGSTEITIYGGKDLHPAEHWVIGDRIAAATYLCAVAATGGELMLAGVQADHLRAVLACLEQAGCHVWAHEDQIALRSIGKIKAIPAVYTAPYPGFPTDAQAIVMAMLAGGTGTSMFVENMFDSRYHHVDELRRMGADIRTDGRVAVVSGVGKLHGARVYSTDLRAGAALVVAGVAAEGVTIVNDLQHIQRGYEDFDAHLRTLGAKIQTVS